jgi:hypothetical protein
MQVSSHATGLRTRQGFALKVAARPTLLAGNGRKNVRDWERRLDRSSDTIGYRIGKFCVLQQAPVSQITHSGLHRCKQIVLTGGRGRALGRTCSFFFLPRDGFSCKFVGAELNFTIIMRQPYHCTRPTLRSYREILHVGPTHFSTTIEFLASSNDNTTTDDFM